MILAKLRTIHHSRRYSSLILNEFSHCAKFAETLESGWNRQINSGFQWSTDFYAFSLFFSQRSVSLHGIGEFFKSQSQDEEYHAKLLAAYLNTRGGKVQLTGVTSPTIKLESFETSANDAFRAALRMKLKKQESLYELYNVAKEVNDLHAMGFIMKNQINAQQMDISRVEEVLGKLEKLEDNVGLFLLDKEFQRTI